MGRGKDFRDRRRGYSDEPPEPPPSFGRPPPRSFDRPPREASRPVPSGPERQAKVKWFNGEKGFGFVELTDGSGEAFLHISVVEAAGHTALEPGTTLTVRVGQGAKGPQITEVTAVDASTAEPSRGRPAGAPGRPPMDRPTGSRLRSADRSGGRGRRAGQMVRSQKGFRFRRGGRQQGCLHPPFGAGARGDLRASGRPAHSHAGGSRRQGTGSYLDRAQERILSGGVLQRK